MAAERVGDLRGQAHCHRDLGVALHQIGLGGAMGHLHRAAQLFGQLADLAGQAKALNRESADRYGEAETLAHLADILDDAGDPEAARRSRLAALGCLTKDNLLEMAQLRRKLGLPEERTTEPPPAGQA